MLLLLASSLGPSRTCPHCQPNCASSSSPSPKVPPPPLLALSRPPHHAATGATGEQKAPPRRGRREKAGGGDAAGGRLRAAPRCVNAGRQTPPRPPPAPHPRPLFFSTQLIPRVFCLSHLLAAPLSLSLSPSSLRVFPVPLLPRSRETGGLCFVPSPSPPAHRAAYEPRGRALPRTRRRWRRLANPFCASHRWPPARAPSPSFCRWSAAKPLA